MANLEIGIEFWPWNDCRELLSYGARHSKAIPFLTSGCAMSFNMKTQ